MDLYLWEHNGEMNLELCHLRPSWFQQIPKQQKASGLKGIASLWRDKYGHNRQMGTSRTEKTEAMPSDAYFRKTQRTMERE